MKNSVFSKFERFEVHDSQTIIGGQNNDTGTTSFIDVTHGTTSLDNYSDPTYNDGEKGDWDDRDACASNIFKK